MESSNLTYKEDHEKFMQNHTGTSVEETVLFLTPSTLTIFLSVYFVKYLDSFKCNKTFYFSLIIFFIEYFFLVVSQVLLFVLPAHNFFIFLVIFSLGTYSIFTIILKSINETIAFKESQILFWNTKLSGKRPYITYFRTSVNLITAICILAVDFTSFPRKFAKTEIYGFGLMDTGVGFFVVCNGLVKNHLFKERMHKNSRLNLLLDQMKQSSILITLGLLRLISTKSVDYQNHDSEYGVHWNFFITLAITKFVASFILTFVSISNVKLLALTILMIHQALLNLGLEEWVISDLPRENIVAANREGISSLLGYISLYLASVEVGNKLKLKSTTIWDDAMLILKLIFSTFLLYFILLFVNSHIQCSRRLANVTYILWIIMLTVYLLALCLLFEIILRLRVGPKMLKDDTQIVPSILLSINFNSLLYFLVANLLTGFVNLSIETLSISEVFTISILLLYMFLNCIISKILFNKSIKFL